MTERVESTDPDIEYMMPKEQATGMVIMMIIGVIMLIFTAGVWYGCP